MGGRGDRLGPVRLDRARSGCKNRVRAAGAVSRACSSDEIYESVAPPNRGVRHTRLRVRRRVGQAFRAPGTTPGRPRVLGATGGGDVASRMLETRPSEDRKLSPRERGGLPKVVIAVATERAPKAFREELRRRSGSTRIRTPPRKG